MSTKTQTAQRGAWTEAEIKAVLASEPYDYQAIKLPFGLSTGGHDRQATADLIFQGDWSGQSVADVGASLGFFLFEAKRHGAGRCVGFDLSNDNVRRGRTLASILNTDVEFDFGDLDAGPLPERFDNVLCLNVLHHLTDPILGINRLVDACRKRLVLEVATVGQHDRHKLGLSWFQAKVLRNLPAVLVGSGTAGAGIKQYYLTISAIENLLRYRRGCFAKVTVSPSGFKNRFLVVAEKRRIGHLVVIASMPGALHGLKANGLGNLGLPGLPDLSALPRLDAENYHVPQPPEMAAQCLFYDFMRPMVTGAMTFSHDPALDILETAEKVTVITVDESAADIRSRLIALQAGAKGRERKALSRALENLTADDMVQTRFREWSDFARSRGERLVARNVDGAGLRIVSDQPVWAK